MLVDIKVCYLLLCIPFKALVYDREEITIELVVLNHGGPLCDLLVVVDVLLQIQVVLAIIIVVFYKLTGDCGHDIFHNHIYNALQSLGTLVWHSVEVKA